MLRLVHSGWLLDAHRPLSAFAALSSRAVQTSPNPQKLSFDNPQLAYNSKSTAELALAYSVLKLCRVRPFVSNAERLIRTSNRILGASATNWMIKHSFFKQFCAGEHPPEVWQAMEALNRAGIGAILDYAAEDDVPTAPPDEQPKSPAVEARGDKVVGRVFDYKSEARCDEHVETFLKAIDTAHKLPSQGFAAIKITALGVPRLLERYSAATEEVHGLFEKFDPWGKGFINKEDFNRAYAELLPGASPWEQARVFAWLDSDESGKIDWVEWCQHTRLKDMPELARRMQETGMSGGRLPAWRASLARELLTEEEVALADALLGRVHRLAEAAASKGVRLMIDAEQTYFQPAIDHLVATLQRRHNVNQPVIFTTYQCYLRDSYERLTTDMERANRAGYKFACKLVRGAYLHQERRRAMEQGYPSPVWNTLEETHANYNRCVQTVLRAVAEGRAEVMIASHNQDSIERTVAMMSQLNLDPATSAVYFGQLLGMADHLTFALGQTGYKAFKYVPYGRVDEVVPYLLRRAVENSDILSGATHELRLIGAELRRRLLPGPLRGSPPPTPPPSLKTAGV